MHQCLSVLCMVLHLYQGNLELMARIHNWIVQLSDNENWTACIITTVAKLLQKLFSLRKNCTIIHLNDQFIETLLLLGFMNQLLADIVVANNNLIDENLPVDYFATKVTICRHLVFHCSIITFLIMWMSPTFIS